MPGRRHRSRSSLWGVPPSDFILRDGEELVLDLHPHWWYFASVGHHRRRLGHHRRPGPVGGLGVAQPAGRRAHHRLAAVAGRALHPLGEHPLHPHQRPHRVARGRGGQARRRVPAAAHQHHLLQPAHLRAHPGPGRPQDRVRLRDRGADLRRHPQPGPGAARDLRPDGGQRVALASTSSGPASPLSRPRRLPPRRRSPRRPRRRRWPTASPICTGSTSRVRSPTPSSRPRRPSCSTRCSCSRRAGASDA